ncbi:MAG: hypothetical protein GY884_07515, partial [Proteobacteria bacterium]|nr:hypothetical protein [Pseudomonadota bacterium]
MNAPPLLALLALLACDGADCSTLEEDYTGSIDWTLEDANGTDVEHTWDLFAPASFTKLPCACDLLAAGTIDSLIIETGVLSLEPLACARELDTLLVLGTQLPALHGLDGLHTLEALALLFNPVLHDLTALSQLSEIGYLWIDDNPGLRSLSGLDGVVRADDVELSNSPSLTDLTGLSGL